MATQPPLGNNAGIKNPYDEQEAAPIGNGDCKDCNYAGNSKIEDGNSIRINGIEALIVKKHVLFTFERVRVSLQLPK